MIEILCFDKEIRKIKLADLNKNRNKQLWIDATNITKEEAEELRKIFDLHPLTSEDMYNSGIRIKVEEFNLYLFCAFYGILEGKNLDLLEMDFVIGNNFLITSHKKPIKSYEELKKDKLKLAALFQKGSDFLMHKLLDVEVDNFFPLLETIDDQIEQLEEAVTKNPRPEILQKRLKLKKRVVRLKKISIPQRDKISFLAKNDYKFISKKCTPYFRDIYDHSIRIADTIDNYREGVGNAFDVYMAAVSNNMNEVMKTLSIIATIALPLSVISGIYGTNFATLPGSGAIYGFWIMILGMAMLCIFMLFFFKRRDWF